MELGSPSGQGSNLDHEMKIELEILKTTKNP